MIKVLFLVANFPPEISTGRLEHELSRSLVQKGKVVQVVTAFPRRYLLNRQISHGGKFLYRQEMDGIKVLRMGPEFSNRDNILARGFEYFFEFFSFFIGGVVSGTADVIVCSSPPLTLALAGYFLGKIKRAPVIVRVGDLHPQVLVDLGLLRSKLIIKLLEAIEKFIYKKIEFFTVLSNGCRQHLIKKGASPERVWVIPNWGKLEELEPAAESDRYFKKASGKFIATYAGSMSWFQDLETIIDAAFILKDYENIRFLLVGDGAQKSHLIEKARQLQLDNVSFLPLKQKKEYLQILQASDVCFVSLKNIKTPTVPSKLMDIMACGRPIIANAPRGEVSEIIFRSNCGVWVEPHNPEKLAEAILRLYKDRAERIRMGQNGRVYLEEHFTLSACIEKYEKIIQQLLAKHNKLRGN